MKKKKKENGCGRTVCSSSSSPCASFFYVSVSFFFFSNVSRCLALLGSRDSLSISSFLSKERKREFASLTREQEGANEGRRELEKESGNSERKERQTIARSKRESFSFAFLNQRRDQNKSKGRNEVFLLSFAQELKTTSVLSLFDRARSVRKGQERKKKQRGFSARDRRSRGIVSILR